MDHPGPVVAGEQLPAVRDRDRVDVDVDHPGLRVRRLGDLVHVADGRNAGADVEELVDAGVEQRPYGPAQELPAGAHGGGEVRRHARRSARPAAGRSRSCAPHRGSSRRPGPRSAGSGRSRSGSPSGSLRRSAPVRSPPTRCRHDGAGPLGAGTRRHRPTRRRRVRWCAQLRPPTPASARCPGRRRRTWWPAPAGAPRCGAAPARRSSASRAPLAPSGCPSAIAPPFGLTCSASSGRPSSRRTATDCAANASFSSTTSTSARSADRAGRAACGWPAPGRCP